MAIAPIFSAELNGQKDFFDLSKKEAFKKGESLAAKDFEEGNYCILTYGRAVFSSETPYVLHLKKHGILIYPIAGCVISDGIVWGAEGYNKAMEGFLFKKLKKDVFAEEGKGFTEARKVLLEIREASKGQQ